jgi:hypothetical protein
MKTKETRVGTWLFSRTATPRTFAVLLLIATLMASARSGSAGIDGIGGKRTLDTMTVNLYVGGEIGRVIALDPTDPAYFPNLISAVTGVYYEIVASQPATRLEGVANAIVQRMPEIVSVQEASLLRIQSPSDIVVGGANAATNVVFDYLQTLLDALAAQGAHYAVASTACQIDVEMPMVNLRTGGFEDVRLTDRDAILVRTDLPRGQFRVKHPCSGSFTNIIVIPGLGLEVKRGWCSVDVFVRGQTFRYINAHIEEETFPQLQVLQVQEVINGPAKSSLPILLAGDFNADVLHRDGSVAYDTITGAGFKDAWAAVNRQNPAGGLTWGHDPLLADPIQLFDRRIDFVFYRGTAFVPSQAEVVDLDLNRSEAPLWASDHAAVAVELQLQGAASARARKAAR